MEDCAASLVTSAIDRDLWQNCWRSLPKPGRALKTFRTIGTSRPAMWRWWQRSACWKRAISLTSVRSTRPFARRGLISTHNGEFHFQIGLPDDRGDSRIQHSVRGWPLLLRASQRGLAPGIHCLLTRCSAAEDHGHLVQSEMDRACSAVDPGIQNICPRFRAAAAGVAEKRRGGRQRAGYASLRRASALLFADKSEHHRSAR